MAGFVSLVGAGPGDPGLLTRKAAERLAQAEVVVYDALVSPAVVALASPEAEVLHRREIGDGKQQAITEYLVRRGLAGKRVVRLKGGDPFVFGRGAEEAEALVEAGVEYEVVPGVSAGIGVPAYAGIPLTHRDHTSDVHFITGHEEPGKDDSAVDYERIVRTGGTLVVFMGVRRLPQVVARLLEVGADPTTPTAVIQWGTTPMQRTVTAELASVVQRVTERGLDHPALVVIGHVVSLRDRLSWFDRRPLWGRRVLVTRAVGQAEPLVQALRDVGAGVVSLPVLEFGPPSDPSQLERAIDELETGARYDWIVFTSANGVRRFWDALARRGHDLRVFARTRVACVGPATAAALRDKALVADLIPDQYRAEGLLRGLTASGAAQGKRFLLPRAEVARNVLPETLRKHGGVVDDVPVYSTGRPATSRETAVQHVDVVDTVTFTSPSAVHNLMDMLGEQAAPLLSARTLAAIGPITAKALTQAGLPCQVVAEESTVDGLVRALMETPS